MSESNNIHDLFPIPIGVYQCNDFIPNLREVNKKLIQSFIEDLIDKGYNNYSAHLSVFQSKRDLDLKNVFKDFLHELKPIFNEFLKSINYSQSFISNFNLNCMWGNLTVGFGYHHPHVHGSGSDSPFSAVYFPCNYVDPEIIENIIFKEEPNNNLSKDSIGPLIFMSPHWELQQTVYNCEDSGKNKYIEVVKEIYPQEGLLVIFPSFLAHYVAPSANASKNNARISFSFFASTV